MFSLNLQIYDPACSMGTPGGLHNVQGPDVNPLNTFQPTELFLHLFFSLKSQPRVLVFINRLKLLWSDETACIVGCIIAQHSCLKVFGGCYAPFPPEPV